MKDLAYRSEICRPESEYWGPAIRIWNRGDGTMLHTAFVSFVFLDGLTVLRRIDDNDYRTLGSVMQACREYLATNPAAPDREYAEGLVRK